MRIRAEGRAEMICRAVRLVETDEVRIAPFGVFVWGREPFDAVQVEVEVANAGSAAATRQVRACCAALGVDVRQTVSLAPGGRGADLAEDRLRDGRTRATGRDAALRAAVPRDGAADHADVLETRVGDGPCAIVDERGILYAKDAAHAGWTKEELAAGVLLQVGACRTRVFEVRPAGKGMLDGVTGVILAEEMAAAYEAARPRLEKAAAEDAAYEAAEGGGGGKDAKAEI